MAKRKKDVHKAPSSQAAAEEADPATVAASGPANPLAKPVDAAHHQPAAAEPAPAIRPKTSYISVYFFAVTFLVRSILIPFYGAANVTGLVGRWSYPSSYTPHGVTCSVEALDGPMFCEHEIVFPDAGYALLSCDAGRGEWNTVMGPLLNPDPRGALWLYDYGNTQKSARLELHGFPETSDFHPLGISHYQDSEKATLFVINHQRTGPSIEVFSINLEAGSDTRVAYIRTISAHPDIKSANGLVAIDHEHLYVTNDHAWSRLADGTAWALTETVLGVLYGQSWITHIDITLATPTFTRAFEGIAFANGITRNPQNTLFVASSVRGTVSVLQARNESTVVLARTEEIKFGYPIDNVHVHTLSSGDDRIIVGGHPSFAALTRLAKSPHAKTAKSPSWLAMAHKAQDISGRRKGDGWHEPPVNAEWDTRTIYQDDGAEFSSVTGAGWDTQRDILIAPGLYESGLLVCRGLLNVM